MSFSLHQLDLKMEKYIGNIPYGFYIECGANDGVSQSNTLYYHQKYNWRGLLIEASAFNADRCKQNRPNDIVENYALVSNSYTASSIRVSVDEACQGLMTQCYDGNSFFEQNPNKLTEVPVTTLTTLLDKHKIEKIDFFSLDVEGYEINVLEGLDFNRYRPKFILLEYANRHKNPNVCYDFLTKKNYRFIESLSCNDDLYIAE